MSKRAFLAARPAGQWLLLVVVLAVAVAACGYPLGRPGYPGDERSISSGQIKQLARQAIHDYVIRRYGRDARPSISSVDLRAVSRVEAQVVGRVSFYRSGRDRSRMRLYFRCVVDRFEGRVYKIDLY